MLNIFAIFIGGGIGAILRYWTTILAQKIWNTSILGTFCVNILGCFLIGFVLGLTIQKPSLIPPQVKLFITVGLLGGLTTFSSFSFEAFNLLKDGKTFYSFLYIAISVIVGLCATFIGYLISKQIKL